MTGGDQNYTLIDHTADVGVEVRGRDFPELLVHAGEAMFGIITDRETVSPSIRSDFKITRGNQNDVLRAWLDNLLSRFNRSDMLFTRFSVKAGTDGTFQGQAWGETFDPLRHPIHTEIKGITYHQFQVRQNPRTGNWTARIIFDV